MSCIAPALSKARLGNPGPKPWTQQRKSHPERGMDEEARKKGTGKIKFINKAGRTKLGI